MREMPTKPVRANQSVRGERFVLLRGFMSSIQHPDDDVNGQIIGTHYGQAWVTYEGRKQGPTRYPRDYPEADAMCFEIVKSIKTQCGNAFKDIYPKEAWMFHFDGI